MASSYTSGAMSGSMMSKKWSTDSVSGIESMMRTAPDPVKMFNSPKPDARTLKKAIK